MRLAILFLCASLLSAQTTDPKLTDAQHASIRDIQLKQKSLEARFLQLQHEESLIQDQYRGSVAELNKAVDAAYAESKLKREDWSLDMETLTFKKVAARRDGPS